MIEIKIPHSFRVGGFTYRIRQGNEVHDNLEELGRWGQHSGVHHRIDLDCAANPEQLSKTFGHELLHAVNFIYCGDKVSEDDIQGLSQGLFQVMEQLGVRFVK